MITWYNRKAIDLDKITSAQPVKSSRANISGPMANH